MKNQKFLNINSEQKEMKKNPKYEIHINFYFSGTHNEQRMHTVNSTMTFQPKGCEMNNIRNYCSKSQCERVFQIIVTHSVYVHNKMP